MDHEYSGSATYWTECPSGLEVVTLPNTSMMGYVVDKYQSLLRLIQKVPNIFSLLRKFGFIRLADEKYPSITWERM